MLEMDLVHPMTQHMMVALNGLKVTVLIERHWTKMDFYTSATMVLKLQAFGEWIPLTLTLVSLQF